MSGVQWTVSDGIARIVLSRPEVSNAFDLSTAQVFGQAVDAAAGEDVKVVLLSAQGDRFCGGGDVASMLDSSDRSGYLLELANELSVHLERLAGLDKPVVAAVHGAVAGAGLAFVLNADVTVAARSTKFVMAYSSIGLTPDCGVSYLLPRAIGQQRALELALTNRVLDAQTAQDWGLVAEVVDDGAALARAEELAAAMAAKSTFALGQARRLIRDSWQSTQLQTMQLEAQTISKAVTTPEATALIEAFSRR